MSECGFPRTLELGQCFGSLKLVNEEEGEVMVKIPLNRTLRCRFFPTRKQISKQTENCSRQILGFLPDYRGYDQQETFFSVLTADSGQDT